MGLLRQTELVLTTLKIDLLKEAGLQTGTVQDNVAKSSKFSSVLLFSFMVNLVYLDFFVH